MGRKPQDSCPENQLRHCLFFRGHIHCGNRIMNDSSAAVLDYCNSLLAGENQRERTDVRDDATYAREIPRHSPRLWRTRLLLRLSRRRIFLRPRSISIPLRPCILPVCISFKPLRRSLWRRPPIEPHTRRGRYTTRHADNSRLGRERESLWIC